MNRDLQLARRVRAALIVSVTALGLAFAVTPSAAVVPTGVSPIADRSSTGVTADALPTVQIDGVVWSQAIVGNTVYAGGEFANARPAGAAPGTQLTPRNNLLAYNLTTGALITGFDPAVNGTIKTVVASPDGSRIYIGGSFTSVDGVARYRIAALDAATGQLITSFFPVVNATVNSLSVTNTTVYAGGIFGASNATTRTRLAAFSADTGALLAWNPTADDTVDAVQLTPDGTHVIVGGSFATVNGSTALGLASIEATTGAMVPFAASQVVKNHGALGAILSLSTDGTSVYGTGYTYGGPSNLEGTFSADPTTGAINWLEDCHGDTYGAFASGGEVYVVSHEHYCANIGGFPDTNPRTVWKRSTAFTNRATGTVLAQDTKTGYASFAGQPSPSLINWFPDLTAGSYTKQDQAAWTVTGTDKYVVEGGEFPSVNGTPQQGLVRFAIPSLAPNKRGPMDNAAATTTPTAAATSATSATITWPTNWDQDNDTLTYRLMRSGSTTPVYTTTAVSQFWNRPTLTYTDTGLTPVTTYKFTVYTSDPDGNTVHTAPATVTTPAAPAPPPPATTTSTITVTPGTPVAGQPVSADILVETADKTPADGSVAIAIDSGASQTVALQAGHARLSTAFASPGQHVVSANYVGDAAFASSSTSATVTVGRDSTAVSAAVSPANPVAGQPLSVHSTVRTIAPGTLTATGTVTVTVDGKAGTPAALTSSGVTTALAGLQPGLHTITVNYSGDTQCAPSTSSATITVAKDSTAVIAATSPARPVAGQPLSVHSTVSTIAPGTLTATGTVTVSVDGAAGTPAALTSSGVTTSLGGLRAGQHTVSVRYSGDMACAPSQTSETITVAKDSTAVSATVSPARPVTGQRFSVHSTVRTIAPGTVRPTGTVTVTVDGRAGTPSKLISSGATTTLAGLQPGRHTIAVRYSGDTEHAAATTSSTVTVAAARAAARVTSSKPNASRHTLVHFRATVRVKAPAAGTPSGTVVFYVDGHARATRTLHSGAATYSARLPKGRHRITIRYTGSRSYYAATSAAITQRER